MEFRVTWNDGDVFINDIFVCQLCWDEESVGHAVASWLAGDIDNSKE